MECRWLHVCFIEHEEQLGFLIIIRSFQANNPWCLAVFSAPDITNEKGLEVEMTGSARPEHNDLLPHRKAGAANLA